MARNVITKKGFKIIGLTIEECKDAGFGFQYYYYDLICDDCNKLINKEKEVYYIPVLNRIFCKDCLKDWYETAKYYPEDKRYEALKYDTISNYIKINNGDINIKDL